MMPQVILSGFGDEASTNKSVVEQFAAFAAIGLEYYSIRFIDLGGGVKNVMQLDVGEVDQLCRLQNQYGLKVATLGSPIGKVKLRDVEDGTKNRFVPFAEYLAKDVARACELAQALGTKLIRGFSFYHPKGTEAAEHVQQAADQLGQIAEVCDKNGLTFGLEVEANLVGQSGQLMAELHRQVNHPALVTIFDGANIITQGYSTEETFEQYLAMKDSLGWIHVKDYRNPPDARRTAHVDEDQLKNFVPVGMGDSGYDRIFRDFAGEISKVERKMKGRGAPGVIVELEPHLKGGGQFGGFSGPDGMGVALRNLSGQLDAAGIGYQLRDFESVRAARGF